MQDMSLSKHAITVSGDAKITQTSPKFGSGCLTLDGTGDYATIAASSDWNWTGDFTIEGWFKTTVDLPAAGLAMLWSNSDSGANTDLHLLRWGSSGDSRKIRIKYYEATVAKFDITSTSTMNVDTWYHISVVRYNGQIKLYINGTSEGTPATYATAMNLSSLPFYIGMSNGSPYYYFPGQVDDFTVHNIALHTSDYTPPDKPYNITAIDRAYAYKANSILKLHCDGADTSTTFTDSSDYGHVATANGNAQITTTDPKIGSGCLLLDGTGDYLTVPFSAVFNLGSVYTVEFWINFSSVAGDRYALEIVNTSGVHTFQVDFYNDNKLAWRDQANDGTGWAYTNSTTFSTDTWYHISFVKNSGIINSYVNGVLQTRSTEAGGASGNALVGVIIGARYDDSYITFVAAKMDEINISNYAKYLENFVPNARGAF